MNFNPVSEPMNSLPLYIYTAYETHEPLAMTRAFGAASVLLATALLLFVVAGWVVRDKSGRDGSHFSLAAETVRRATPFLRHDSMGRWRSETFVTRGDSRRRRSPGSELARWGHLSSWAAILSRSTGWARAGRPMPSTSGSRTSIPMGSTSRSIRTDTSRVVKTSKTRSRTSLSLPMAIRASTPRLESPISPTAVCTPTCRWPTVALRFPIRSNIDGTQSRTCGFWAKRWPEIFTNQITNWMIPRSPRTIRGRAPLHPHRPRSPVGGVGCHTTADRLLLHRVPEHLELIRRTVGGDPVLPSAGQPADCPGRFQLEP